MLRLLTILLLVLIYLFPPAAFAAEISKEDKGSGLPVPRFVSLKSEEVNIRTGPGTRYPISWVYKRSGMPVEIIEEFDMWRKIRDMEGTSGWVHKTMLDGRRSVIIIGKKAAILRTDPEQGAKPMLKIEPNVIAKFMECEKKWCKIQVDGRKGWLEKSSIWGVYEKE